MGFFFLRSGAFNITSVLKMHSKIMFSIKLSVKPNRQFESCLIILEKKKKIGFMMSFFRYHKNVLNLS